MNSAQKADGDSQPLSSSPVISPRELQWIAEAIPATEWRRCGRELHLQENDLDEIQHFTCPGLGILEAATQMLLKWRKSTENATFQQLYACLERLNFPCLTKKIKEVAKLRHITVNVRLSSRVTGSPGGNNRDCFEADGGSNPEDSSGRESAADVFLDSEDLHVEPFDNPAVVRVRPDYSASSRRPGNEPDIDFGETLEFSHVWPFSCLLFLKRKLPFVRTLVMLAIFILVLVQLCVVFILFISSVFFRALSAGDVVFFVMFNILRLFTRCIVPIVVISTVADILDQKLDHMSQPAAEKDFLTELKCKENETIVKRWAGKFWNKTDEQKSLSEILQGIHYRLATELQSMCVSAVINSALLSLLLFLFGASSYETEQVYLHHNLATLLSVIDSLSLPVMVCSCGIAVAFYFHDQQIKYMVSCALAVERNFSGTESNARLRKAAGNWIRSFENNWSLLELFFHVCIYVYSIILMAFGTALRPLSIDVPERVEPNAHFYWLLFVSIFTFSHLFATTIRLSSRGAARYRWIGISLQEFVLLLYCFLGDHVPQFGPYLDIMYGIIPSGYIFAFLWGEIYHEYKLALHNKSEHRARHLLKLFREILQVIFLGGSLVVCTFSQWFLLYKNK